MCNQRGTEEHSRSACSGRFRKHCPCDNNDVNLIHCIDKWGLERVLSRREPS